MSKTTTADKSAVSNWEKHATHDQATQAISMKRIGNETSIVYACAIAHQLAKAPDHAANIAAQLVEILQQDLASHPELRLQGLIIQATATGFIHFKVGDRAIAAWLDLLLANVQLLQPLPVKPLSEAERQLMLQASVLFEAQHAHARCCSLLHHAHRESLIYLDALEASPQDWRFHSPATLPWLTSTDQLSFQHSVDRMLITQLFDAHNQLFDASRPPTQASVLRSTESVARAFQAFHRAHPLWEKAQEDTSSTLTRLGLLMITQRVLHLLLRDGLNLCPTTEL